VEQNLALYRAISGEPSDLNAFRAAIVAEEPIIYEFLPIASYGQF
jgi:hypothetical protein